MELFKYELQNSEQFWVDVVNPSPLDLETLAKEYKLHWTSVQDCLDPEHLPKIEKIDDMRFLIVRAFDGNSNQDADTIQELTRKVAVFISNKFILTVHRVDLDFIADLRRRCHRWEKTQLLCELLKNVFDSYEKPVQAASDTVEKIEGLTFMGKTTSSIIEDSYYLRRRALVMKRLVHMTADLVPRLDPTMFPSSPYFQDLKDTIDSMIFFVDDLAEKANSLINLHLSLESNRVNEIFRVLTIFSAFFMPLTFIASIYGMNFQFMPELASPYGYPLVLGSMFGTAVVIFLWFKKRGWLK